VETIGTKKFESALGPEDLDEGPGCVSHTAVLGAIASPEEALSAPLRHPDRFASTCVKVA